jgi:transcriptional regulator with XRE-family HTH domain
LDAEIGQRLRAARLARGWSIKYLARQAGIAFQQIHKYESGRDRVPASRLFVLSNALKVSISLFFPEEDVSFRPSRKMNQIRAPEVVEFATACKKLWGDSRLAQLMKFAKKLTGARERAGDSTT